MRPRVLGGLGCVRDGTAWLPSGQISGTISNEGKHITTNLVWEVEPAYNLLANTVQLSDGIVEYVGHNILRGQGSQFSNPKEVIGVRIATSVHCD